MLFRIILISALAISLYSCSKKDEIIYEPQKKIYFLGTLVFFIFIFLSFLYDTEFGNKYVLIL